MARILFRPYNSVRRPSSLYADTLDRVSRASFCAGYRYFRLLVDLTRFRALDGLRFSYRHLRIVSRQFAVDKVCDRTFVQTKLRLDVIREGANRVQELYR
jgi:hypothetical protein